MKHSNSVPYIIYRSPRDYQCMNYIIINCDEEILVNYSPSAYLMMVTGSSLVPAVKKPIPPDPFITDRKNARRLLVLAAFRVQDKKETFDTLVTAFQDLSLMINKHRRQPDAMTGSPSEVGNTAQADRDQLCSFFHKQSYEATAIRYPLWNTRFFHCGKK